MSSLPSNPLQPTPTPPQSPTAAQRITGIISAIVAAVVTGAATKGIDISPQLQSAIVIGVSALVYDVAQDVHNWAASKL